MQTFHGNCEPERDSGQRRNGYCSHTGMDYPGRERHTVLIISRKETEIVTIEPIAGLDPNLTLQQAFALGPIAIRIVRVNGHRVRLAIDAPPALKIWRGPHGDLTVEGSERLRTADDSVSRPSA